MSFWDMAAEIGRAVENELYKKNEEFKAEMKRKMKQNLRGRSDREIEHAYRNRYDNPNLADWQITVIENEARRRGIH